MWTELWTEQQLSSVANACRWLLLDRPVSPTLFKTFLQNKLAHTHPELADRIAALHTSQFEQLMGHLREQQSFSRSLVFG